MLLKYHVINVFNRAKYASMKRSLLNGQLVNFKSLNKNNSIRLTVFDYEVIGDAPVPAEWIAKRKNKLVRVSQY